MAQDPRGYTRQYKTAVYAASGIIETRPCQLYVLFGYNSAITEQFIQLHDVIALPANGEVPAISFLIQPEDNFFFGLGEVGWRFSAGIVWCNSTTHNTKTIGAANCWVNAYII